jgi:signal transduction histidine kinase
VAIAINGGAARRFLARVPADIAEATANLDRIIKDCRRASGVVDSILACFDERIGNGQPIDVNEIALEVLQSSREELSEHRVTTRTELASEQPLISGHKRQLQQAISNSIQKAIEAMDNTTDQDRVLRVRTGLQNSDAIVVVIEDSGQGFDPKHAMRLCREEVRSSREANIIPIFRFRVC